MLLLTLWHFLFYYINIMRHSQVLLKIADNNNSFFKLLQIIIYKKAQEAYLEESNMLLAL
jgi:hypothetical protein